MIILLVMLDGIDEGERRLTARQLGQRRHNGQQIVARTEPPVASRLIDRLFGQRSTINDGAVPGPQGVGHRIGKGQALPGIITKCYQIDCRVEFP